MGDWRACGIFPGLLPAGISFAQRESSKKLK